MRNLKRALSLTLASVMLLGMMVVGSSAAKGYSDVDDADNVEAIEVLQAVNIMTGDENGNFNPDGEVTRAQMARIMAALLALKTDYYVGTNPFNDVPDWAAPFVAACYTEGVISGYGDGRFGSDDSVTTVQAASMLMRALGYFQYPSDVADGFEVATVRQAGRIDLFNGIDSTATAPLTRNQVAQMILNTLKSGMVEPDDNTLNITTTAGNAVSTVTGGRVNYVYVTSRESYATAIRGPEFSSWYGNGNGGATATTNLNAPIVDLGEKIYQGDLRMFSDQDNFDRPATKWEYKTIEIGTYTDEETYTYTKSVSNKDLYNRMGSIAMAYDWAVYRNGEFLGGNELKPVSNSTSTWNNTAVGTLTQIYVMPDANSNSGTVIVSMIDTMLAEVVRVGTDSFTVSYLTSDATNTNIMSKTRQTQIDAEATGFEVGDRLLVRLYEDGDRYTVADYAVSQTIDGTVTAVKARYDNGEVDGSYAVMDGTTYNYVGKTFAKDLAETSLDNPTISAANTLYLDYYDNMIAFEATERHVNYLYLKASHEYLGKYQADVTFSDGTSEIISINELNGKKVNTADNRVANDPMVYAYTQDGTNYKLWSLKDANPVTDVQPDINDWTNAPRYDGTNYRGGYDNGFSVDGGLSYSIRNNQNSIRLISGTDRNVITLNNATIFVDVEGGKVYNGYANVPTMTEIDFWAIYNRQLNADVVFITAGADNSTSDSFFYVKGTKPLTEKSASEAAKADVKNVGGTNYYTYDVWMNGEDTTITLKGTNLDADGAIIREHNLYKIETINTDGQVTKASRVSEFGLSYLTGTNYAETAVSGSLRIVEPSNGGVAPINGAKHNETEDFANDPNHANSAVHDAGTVHRAYSYDKDTIFMTVRINTNGNKTVEMSHSATTINASMDNNRDGHNNVYVIAVDDQDSRAPKATLVYIVEHESTSGGQNVGDGVTTFPFGNITLKVPAGKTSNQYAAFAGSDDATFQFVPEIGATPGTATNYTYDWTIKTEGGVLMGGGHETAQNVDTIGILSKTTSSNRLNTNEKYVIEVTDIFADFYALDVENETEIDDSKISVFEGTSSNNIPYGTPADTIRMAFAKDSVKFFQKAKVTFTVENARGVTLATTASVVDGSANVTAVAGQANTYCAEMAVKADGSIQAADVLTGIRADGNGPVIITITDVEDASTTARVTFQLDAASAKFAKLSGTGVATNVTAGTPLNSVDPNSNITVTMDERITDADVTFKYNGGIVNQAGTAKNMTNMNAFDSETLKDLPTPTAGQNVVINVTITPKEYTLKAANFSLVGTATIPTGGITFDATGKMTSTTGFLTGVATASGNYLISMNNGDPVGFTAEADKSVNATAAKTFTVNPTVLMGDTPVSLKVVDAKLVGDGSKMLITGDTTAADNLGVADLTGKYQVRAEVTSGTGYYDTTAKKWYVTENSVLTITITAGQLPASGTDTVTISGAGATLSQASNDFKADTTGSATLTATITDDWTPLFNTSSHAS